MVKIFTQLVPSPFGRYENKLELDSTRHDRVRFNGRSCYAVWTTDPEWKVIDIAFSFTNRVPTVLHPWRRERYIDIGPEYWMSEEVVNGLSNAGGGTHANMAPIHMKLLRLTTCITLHAPVQLSVMSSSLVGPEPNIIHTGPAFYSVSRPALYGPCPQSGTQNTPVCPERLEDVCYGITQSTSATQNGADVTNQQDSFNPLVEAMAKLFPITPDTTLDPRPIREHPPPSPPPSSSRTLPPAYSSAGGLHTVVTDEWTYVQSGPRAEVLTTASLPCTPINNLPSPSAAPGQIDGLEEF